MAVFNIVYCSLSPSHLGATLPVWMFSLFSLKKSISAQNSLSPDFFPSFTFSCHCRPFAQAFCFSIFFVCIPQLTVASFSSFIVGYICIYAIFHNQANTSIWGLVAQYLTQLFKQKKHDTCCCNYIHQKKGCTFKDTWKMYSFQSHVL